MTELVVRPLADAFMQVGVFMALLVGPFGYARYRWGAHLDAALLRRRRLAPLLAALLTVPPGCAGAIIVVALYARGAVSFGAAVAALVATMGDASWPLLAAEPVLTAQLKVLLVGVGALSGYVVDALGIAPTRTPADVVPAQPPVTRRGLSALDAADRLQLHAVGVLPGLLWVAVGTGAVVSLPVTFQLMDPAAVGRTALGGLDPYLALGATGTLVAVVGFLRRGGRVADDSPDSAHPTSVGQVLRHGADEVAFVCVWVAVAYLAWAWGSHLTGFDGSALPVLGLVGVVVGALVGLVPGCGVQIVFTGLFLAGGMPVSTLVANTISQDGDALIPLLALQPRAALLATALTTVPALLTGSALLLL